MLFDFMIKLFRIIAFLEGLSYLLLLFIAMPIKYIHEDAFYVKLLGMPHGILFLLYIVFIFFLRFSNGRIKLHFFKCIIASVVPFGTLYLDRMLFRHI